MALSDGFQFRFVFPWKRRGIFKEISGECLTNKPSKEYRHEYGQFIYTTAEIPTETEPKSCFNQNLTSNKIWWPGIDHQIETLTGSCIQCQAANNSKTFEPLKMTTMPPKPWQVVHSDFCGPFPSGDYLLVLMDEHSRFAEVEIIRSTSTTVTIDGFPIEFVSDNGPPYNGNEFHNYLAENGIKHRNITPYWPQANAHVERFMRTIEKSVRIAHAQGKNWKTELNRFS